MSMHIDSSYGLQCTETRESQSRQTFVPEKLWRLGPRQRVPDTNPCSFQSEIIGGIQKGTKDRRGRSNSPQCTTSREDRQIVRMAVTYRSVTSRTVAPPH
ncbi:hypothetical protein TNCV_2285091 [Trichonephila clavipes]|nr:hypothetical protein TNCV_2285091 [Trichonephila clavipes]